MVKKLVLKVGDLFWTRLKGAHFCTIQPWTLHSVLDDLVFWHTHIAQAATSERYPSSIRAVRTCLSHPRVQMIGLGRLVTIPYVDPAYCRYHFRRRLQVRFEACSTHVRLLIKRHYVHNDVGRSAHKCHDVSRMIVALSNRSRIEVKS